ncbi:MAG: SoxR reducing system RseC family protein [Rikenellaceae bacterium]
MRGEIKHLGKVIEINKDYVRVSVMAQSACAACHAKNVCGAGDQQEKIIDVRDVHDSYAIDEVVEVSITTHNGSKAVVLAYLIPFIILMVTLLLMLNYGYGEATAALASLGAMAVYYLCLYLSRHKIEQKIHFTITKTNQN